MKLYYHPVSTVSRPVVLFALDSGIVLDYQVVARREAEQRKGLASIPDLCLTVPYFDEDIHSLDGLLRLGEAIWR